MDNYKLPSGDEISIAPSFGCNLVSWKVGGAQVLHAPEDFTSSIDHFYKGGNPVLFPAVGRTWDVSSGEPVQGIYSVFGKTGRFNMPIHGILTLTEWAKHASEQSADSIKASYQLMVPSIVKEMSYPFDLELMLYYMLSPGTLEVTAEISNAGTETAPFAYGLHPYFAIPNGDRKGVEVELPTQSKMVLDSELLIPTGETEPTPSRFSLEQGVSYDCVYTQLYGRQASLSFEGIGKRVVISFDENIENLVIYADPKLPAVCIEPWTRGLGAFSLLSEPNWQDNPAINTLEPGESRSITVRYAVEQF